MESKWFHHISSTKYIFPFLSKMIALHQNVANCQNTLTELTLRWRILLQNVWMGQMCMTDVGTTQDYFILPALPVGGLPISRTGLTEWSLFATAPFQSSCQVEKIYWFSRGTKNSSMGSPHEGSIRWPIAPWANALTTELHLSPWFYRGDHSRNHSVLWV